MNFDKIRAATLGDLTNTKVRFSYYGRFMVVLFGNKHHILDYNDSSIHVVVGSVTEAQDYIDSVIRSELEGEQ